MSARWILSMQPNDLFRHAGEIDPCGLELGAARLHESYDTGRRLGLFEQTRI